MHDVMIQAARLITPYKLRSYELMQIGAGSRVLDMGCGGGVDTAQLAQIVGQAGHVVGIDRDQPSLQRASAAGAPSKRAEHLMAIAERLPFRNASFDASRSDRVFQHLHEPERAVRELRRVTRPGGWVVLAESDDATYTQD